MIEVSKDSKWHIKRKIEILKKYPEISKLQKCYPLSLIYILFLVLLQNLIGYLLQILDFSIFQIGIISLINANLFYHSLSSFIHENSHGLIIGYKFRNLVSFLLEFGLCSFGQHIDYEVTHKRNHHVSLNMIDIDSECTNKKHMSNHANISNNLYFNRIFNFIDLLPLGSIISQELGKNRLSQDDKIKVKKLKKYFDISDFDKICKKILMITSLFFIYYLYSLGYYKFILFKLWSVSIYTGKFSIFRRGQSISEHKADDYNNNVATQSTYSFFENFFGFNTGYHDEHHTFPTIPWVNLPKVKKIASDFFIYENKESYFTLWFRWFKNDFKNTYYRKCH